MKCIWHANSDIMDVAGEGSAVLLCLLPSVENGNISLPVSDTVGDNPCADTANALFWC